MTYQPQNVIIRGDITILVVEGNVDISVFVSDFAHEFYQDRRLTALVLVFTEQVQYNWQLRTALPVKPPINILTLIIVQTVIFLILRLF